MTASPSPTTLAARREITGWRLRALAVALVALTGSGLAVTALTDGALENSDLSAWDPSVTAEVVADRAGWLTTLAQAATFSGSLTVVGLLTLAVFTWLGPIRRRWRAAGVVAATMGVSAAATVGLKDLIGRLRPPAPLVLGPVDTGFAFPSGHTLNSTVFFGLVAGLVLLRVRGWWARLAVIAAWVAASLAVGVSRIYLGYHWLTDVLAGWALAVGILAAAAALCLVLLAPRRHQPRGELQPVEVSRDAAST